MTMRRRAVRQSKNRGFQTTKPVNWVAPTGGLRTDKPLENLPPNAASTLINFFPEPGYVRPRNGSNNWATGLGGTVQTLMPFYGAGVDKMFAAANGDIFDVTSAVSSPSPVHTGATNAVYSFANFQTSAGGWLMACNGADAVLSYNGTAWANAGITGNTNPLIAVTNFQSRLYFLEKNSPFLWYMPTLGITGALQGSLNIGAVFKFGGTPVNVSTWTMQTLSGPVEMLCVISSEGEVIIYTGSDPTSSSSFSKLGSAKLGFPLGGVKCFYSVGGDLAVMTVDGIVPLSRAIALDPSATDQSALTGPIAPTWLQVVQAIGRTVPGWQLMIYPSRRMAIVNIPDPVSGPYQLVMNTETQAWTKFVGMPSTVWLAWEGGLYFGTADGRVVQGDIGSNDVVMMGSTALTAPIDCLSVGAWQRMGEGMAPKVSTLIGIDCMVDKTVTLFAGVSFDFNPSTPISAGGGLVQIPGATWDVSLWDIAKWGGTVGARFIADASGVGVVFAPTVRALINGTTGENSGFQLIGGSLLVEQGRGI